MQIPKKIQIAGKTFHIVYDTKYYSSIKSYGEAQYDQGKIILDDITKTGYTREKIEESFIHECLHLCSNIGRLDIPESTVGILGELLYQVIKQIDEVRKGV